MMFPWFRHPQKKKPSSTDSEEVLKRMDGKEIAYVTERIRDADGNVTERVLGKGGRVSTHTDLITVVCNGTPVFICPKESAVCNDLMSLAGVIIQGIDRDTQTERTIVVHFQYYRR